METEILLAQINRSFNPETEPDYLVERFQSSLENLEKDIDAWNKKYGVHLELGKRQVKIHEDSVYSYTYRTDVYVKIKKEDVVWFNLVIGDIEPSNRIIHDDNRGWLFAWQEIQYE